MHVSFRWLTVCMLGVGFCLHGVASGENVAKSAALRVGMIQTLFRGMDEKTAQAQGALLSDVMSIQAGMPCSVTIYPDSAKIADKLQDGELQLAVMHGIEYAWVKDRYPELQPLVLAMNKAIRLRAYVMVRDDGNVRSLADLKGKPLAMPKRSLNHIHLYVNKLLTDAKEDPATFFQPALVLGSTDAALDALVEGTNNAAACVIDGVALASYKERKPARAQQLRVLLESTEFPTATIVFKPNATAPEIVKKLQDSLQTAHERPFSRQMLTLWRLSNFAAVPEDYCELCDTIHKEYPQPVVPISFVVEPPKATVQGK